MILQETVSVGYLSMVKMKAQAPDLQFSSLSQFICGRLCCIPTKILTNNASTAVAVVCARMQTMITMTKFQY